MRRLVVVLWGLRGNFGRIIMGDVAEEEFLR